LDGRGGYALVLIDADQEGKDIGFGLPDTMERVSEDRVLGDDTFARLFPNDEGYKRVEPKLPPVRMEIAKVGQPVDPWEKSDDPKGWKAPSPTYKQGMGDNFNVRLVFKKKKNDEGHMHDPANELEYVVKEYTLGNDRYKAASSRVWEYYAPKSPYNEKLLRGEVRDSENTKKVNFVFPDGTEDAKFVTPGSNRVIGDKPVMIAYNRNETTRWLLKDEDGDGVFEKKREIPMPRESTGYYSSYFFSAPKSRGGYDDSDSIFPAISPPERPENPLP
jgi:hypothetical protein